MHGAVQLRARILISCFVCVVSAIGHAQAIFDFDLKALYEAHEWRALNNRLRSTEGIPLYQGAIGVTFNQDPQRTESLLLSVISAAPHSPEAYDAAEWLSHLYLYRGQYRSLVSIMDGRWAAFPDKSEKSDEQAAINGFRGLPNQVQRSSRPSTINHEDESIFIPLSINGTSATYFFDTGAWISCMSESEAKRLHLKVRNSLGQLGQSAGAHVGFRTAVAKNVVVGNTHFEDVSFAVFPDNQEPWSDLAPGRRGIVGMPILVALKNLRWEKSGGLEIAQPSRPFDMEKSNLTFDDDHLVVSATIQNQKVSGTVDTGAVDTDLYQPFADQFKDLIKRLGKKDSRELHGVGHAEKYDSITLPELQINIGDAETVLSPAHVILKSIGAKGCVGNFGLDLYKQGPAFTIDFDAMTLRIVSPNKVAR